MQRLAVTVNFTKTTTGFNDFFDIGCKTMFIMIENVSTDLCWHE